MDSAPTAIMFPGQGSQQDQMRSYAESYCPDLVESVSNRLGDNPFDLVDEGTRYRQPAIYCASVGRWRAAGSPVPEYMVGHSLGEVTAAACAGAFTLEEGAQLAVARGRAMQRASQQNPGRMLAVLGDTKEVAKVAMSLGLTIAGDNAPDQQVLSGSAAMIDEAKIQLQHKGIASVKLRGLGAFNSPAMVTAISEFRESLREVKVGPTEATLISSVGARPVKDLREELLSALVRPVLWRQALELLTFFGVREFLDAGPGSVLTGLASRILDDEHEVAPLVSDRLAHA